LEDQTKDSNLKDDTTQTLNRQDAEDQSVLQMRKYDSNVSRNYAPTYINAKTRNYSLNRGTSDQIQAPDREMK